VAASLHRLARHEGRHGRRSRAAPRRVLVGIGQPRRRRRAGCIRRSRRDGVRRSRWDGVQRSRRDGSRRRIRRQHRHVRPGRSRLPVSGGLLGMRQQPDHLLLPAGVLAPRRLRTRCGLLVPRRQLRQQQNRLLPVTRHGRGTGLRPATDLRLRRQPLRQLVRRRRRPRLAERRPDERLCLPAPTLWRPPVGFVLPDAVLHGLERLRAVRHVQVPLCTTVVRLHPAQPGRLPLRAAPVGPRQAHLQRLKRATGARRPARR
jgi:hypothetical protein